LANLESWATIGSHFLCDIVELGLRFIGLLGVLVEAKQNGYISAVQPVLDSLIAKAGFWVSQALYRRVLQAAGE